MSNNKLFETNERQSRPGKRYTVIGPRTGGFLMYHLWIAVSTMLNETTDETMAFACTSTGKIKDFTEIDSIRPGDHEEMVARWNRKR